MVNLYEYQKDYLQAMPPRAIFAADTGTGKTFMALAHYAQHGGGQPLLVLAPASKIRTGDWERDITEYFGAGNEPDYTIYSYEKFSRVPSLTQFRDGKRAIWHSYSPKHGGTQHAVIADEIHRAKNPQSGVGKALWSTTYSARFFVGLSASPLPNGWIDFANYSKVFGFTRNITEFKNRYCEYQTYKGFPELIRYYREGELAKQWQLVSKLLNKSEALDLPEQTFIGVNFKRPGTYIKTILDRVSPDGTILDSAPALAHALRQTLTPVKLDYVSDLVEGTTENIVIFYNYISERDAILDMLAKKHKGKTVYRQDGEKHELPSKETWPGVHNSVTVAHYRSGSTGVEMTYATIVIYFSPTYSYADYYQSLGRVYRHGQTRKTTVYNLRTRDSIEEDVYTCLQGKNDFQASQWVANK